MEPHAEPPTSDIASIDEALRAAVRHHESGRLAEAERHYRQILAVQPRHADALHLLGVMALQTGRPQEALDSISRAIAIQGGQAALHYHLGQACHALGSMPEAQTSFAEAARLDPTLAEAHYHLGLIEHHAGQLAAAAAHYRRALETRSDFLEARVNLGDVLRTEGKLAEAAEAYRSAALSHPDCLEALHNLGAALVDLGRFDDALSWLQRALALQPCLALAHYNLARANKGLGRHAEAIALYRRALAAQPELAIAHYGLANLLQEQGKLAEATQAYRQALVINPDDPEALTNYGKVLHKLGDSQGALEHYNRAVELKPNLPEAHFSRAMILLRQGDFARGWQDYEWRVKLSKFPLMVTQEPLWNGSPLAGSTLLVHAEQGLGDTLQFIRFLPMVKSLASSVVARVQAPLVPLLKQSGYDVVGDDEELPRFEWQVPLMSLPKILGTNLSNIPCKIPYLAASSKLIEQWREKLASIDGFKIGIAWQGNPTHVSDRIRSIPLNDFRALAEVPGVALISLQKEKDLSAEAVAAADRAGVITLEDLDVQSGAFMDTAAVMQLMDLVVSCDTAAAHLAGGLGLRVWVALPVAADWRWLADRHDSPWYPTIRLFRQTTPGGWSSVFERMAAELADLMARGPDTRSCKAK